MRQRQGWQQQGRQQRVGLPPVPALKMTAAVVPKEQLALLQGRGRVRARVRARVRGITKPTDTVTGLHAARPVRCVSSVRRVCTGCGTTTGGTCYM